MNQRAQELHLGLDISGIRNVTHFPHLAELAPVHLLPEAVEPEVDGEAGWWSSGQPHRSGAWDSQA